VQFTPVKFSQIKPTLSLFLKTSGSSYVLNGLKFWKKISEGNGWKIGSSMLTAQSYISVHISTCKLTQQWMVNIPQFLLI